MNSLYCYVALIQFIGAFNFAFVLDVFEKKLSQYFINIKEHCSEKFDEIHGKIILDITSVQSYSPIESGGMTNKDELDELAKSFNNLLKKKDTSRAQMEGKIASRYKPRLSQQMFLMAGIYSLLALFFICRIEDLKNNPYLVERWEWIFEVFNFVVMLEFCFVVCFEIYYLSRNENKALSHPSRAFTWCAISVLVIAPLIAWFCPQIYSCHYFIITHDWIYLIFLVIPFMAFIFTLLLFGVSIMPNLVTLQFKTWTLKRSWNKLRKRKKDVLSPYKHLKISEPTLS